jgi:hypothetical protein
MQVLKIQNGLHQTTGANAMQVQRPPRCVPGGSGRQYFGPKTQPTPCPGSLMTVVVTKESADNSLLGGLLAKKAGKLPLFLENFQWNSWAHSQN